MLVAMLSTDPTVGKKGTNIFGVEHTWVKHVKVIDFINCLQEIQSWYVDHWHNTLEIHHLNESMISGDKPFIFLQE
jgi:hypothetical protein